MSKSLSRLAAYAGSAAMLATSLVPSPASAGGGVSIGYGYGSPYYGGYYGYDSYGRRHHRRDRIDAGDVIAGVAILGVIAAIANAGKSRSRSDDRRNRDRNDDYHDWRNNDSGYRQSSNDRSDNYRSDTRMNEQRAVDGCVAAAERSANGGRVDVVERVTMTNRGYSVSGTVMRDTRDRGSYARRDGFQCIYDGGQVQSINIDGGLTPAP